MHSSPFIRLSLLSAFVVTPLALAEGQGRARLSSGVDLGALIQREGPDLWHSATRVAPSFRLDQRFARLSLDGSIVGTGQTVMLDHGTVDAVFSPAPFGAFRLNVGGRAERLASFEYSPRTVTTVESSLSYAAGEGGAWLGAAVEHSPQVDSTPTTPMLRFGIWRRVGPATISLSSASRSALFGGTASTPPKFSPDSQINQITGEITHYMKEVTKGKAGTPSIARLWSETELGVSWARGPVALDATVAGRPAVDSSPRAFWGRLSAVVQATPGVAFIASGGNEPARISVGLPPRRVATLGMRLSTAALLRPARAAPVRPTAAEVKMRSLGDNIYVVTMNVSRARTVELSGDFGKWQPVALTETSPDTWETTLMLPPGTYRMNVRVDGDRWKAPPGMATVADEFNGTVGIVVVR